MAKQVEFVHVPAAMKETTFRHDSTVGKRAKKEKKTSYTHIGCDVKIMISIIIRLRRQRRWGDGGVGSGKCVIVFDFC